MSRRGIIIKANNSDISWDREAILLGGGEYAVGHLISRCKNSRWPLLCWKFKELTGTGTSRGWHEVTLKHQGRVRGDARFKQCLTITLIAIMRDKVLVRPLNVGDAPVTEADQVMNGKIGPSNIISSYPRSSLFSLVVNDYYRKHLLV